MTYFYHYTNRAGFNGIASSCEASHRQGQWCNQSVSGNWRLKASQPQPGSWYSGQHVKGFYLTDQSPDVLQGDERALGKLGLGKLRSEDQFVFIFRSQDGSFFPGDNNRERYRINQYPNTRKYYIQNKNIDTDDLIYLVKSCCIWCGPLSQWNAIKNELDRH